MSAWIARTVTRFVGLKNISMEIVWLKESSARHAVPVSCNLGSCEVSPLFDHRWSEGACRLDISVVLQPKVFAQWL